MFPGVDKNWFGDTDVVIGKIVIEQNGYFALRGLIEATKADRMAGIVSDRCPAALVRCSFEQLDVAVLGGCPRDANRIQLATHRR